jgi:hypothetical protein
VAGKELAPAKEREDQRRAHALRASLTLRLSPDAEMRLVECLEHLLFDRRVAILDRRLALTVEIFDEASIDLASRGSDVWFARDYCKERSIRGS